VLSSILSSFQEVCHRYWPLEVETTECYGKYEVTLISEENCGEYIIRNIDSSEIQPTVSGHNCLNITQFQYLRWPEDSIPSSTTGVLEVANLVQNVQISSGNKTIVIMCKYVNFMVKWANFMLTSCYLK